MPREARPRWSKRRRRWVAAIGDPGKDGRAKEISAPPEIGERDGAAAWVWFRKRVDAGATVPVDPDDPAVDPIFEAFLGDVERRAESGEVTRKHFVHVSIHLGRFSSWKPTPRDPKMGERRAADLAPGDVEAFAAAMLASGSSPHYVANGCAAVASAFNWATRRSLGRPALLASSPIKGFRTPTVPVGPERFAERDLAGRFLWWFRRYAVGRLGPVAEPSGYHEMDEAGKRAFRLKHDWRRKAASRYHRQTIAMVRLMMHSGCRPGEACVMQWGDIRWDAGETKLGYKYAKVVIPPARWKAGKKTGRARTVYLSPSITRMVRRLSEAEGRHPTSVFVHGRGRGVTGGGQPWPSGSALSQAIRRARRFGVAAGVDLPDEGPGRVVNYLWRHTAASTLIMMGVDLATVAELLGTSVDMLRRHYAHLLDDHLAAAAEAFAVRPRARPSA